MTYGGEVAADVTVARGSTVLLPKTHCSGRASCGMNWGATEASYQGVLHEAMRELPDAITPAIAAAVKAGPSSLRRAQRRAFRRAAPPFLGVGRVLGSCKVELDRCRQLVEEQLDPRATIYGTASQSSMNITVPSLPPRRCVLRSSRPA